MGKILFVGGLDYAVNDSQLNALFSKFGKVKSTNIIIDRQTDLSKGFGFVEMENEDSAKLAINKLNNSTFSNRNLSVREAKPRKF